MTLRHRVTRLEAGPGARPENGRGCEKLTALLGRIEAAVLAEGDASDRPDVPPLERAVRRYLRGDADPAEALRDLVDGRWQ